MRRKILNKKLLFLVVPIIAVVLFPQWVFAGVWGPYSTWTSTAASYGPYYGKAVLYEYTDSSGNLKLSPKAYEITFSTSAVNSIKNYYYNGVNGTKLYYTFDIAVNNDNDTHLDGYNIVTNLPSPKPDLDDDPEPFGNGYRDETEVVSLSPYSIKAGIPYRVESYFLVKRKPSYSAPVYIAFGSQESYYHWSGEYDTYYYTTHKTLRYPW